MQGSPRAFRSCYGGGGVVSFDGKDDTTDQHSSRIDRPALASFEHEQPVNEPSLKRKRKAHEKANVIRAHRRLVFKDCGIPITQFRNKRELLEVLIELIQRTCCCCEIIGLSNPPSCLVHERVVKKDLLHRDISIRNMMMLKERNTDIY